MRIVIIDYGMGNLKSIQGALRYLGVEDICVSFQKSEIEQADKIMLPGVGAFNEAMQNIRQRKLDVILSEQVMTIKKPILGICLGMQLMGSSSTENGENQGLDFIPAKTQRFSKTAKIPHVGFNQVNVSQPSKLYQGLTGNIDFYFIHSFRMEAEPNINPCLCRYGEEVFVASYEVNNVVGVQFHPELSQANGLKLLNNFITQF